MMKMLFDLHTHTVASHGKGTARDNIERALRLGLIKIAVSDHAMGHVSYGIRDVEAYLSTLEQLKEEYAGRIEVLRGIECNLLGEQGESEMNAVLLPRFDVRILGYHKFIATRGLSYSAYCYLTPRSNIERNTAAVLRALETGMYTILAHPGYAMPVDLARVAAACRDTDTLFEINQKHGGLTKEMLQEAAAEGCRFILSSDAHTPENVGNAPAACALAEQAGILDLVVNGARKETES